MISKLLRLYWRETCNSRTLAFLVLMLLLTALLLSNLPLTGTGKTKMYNPVRVSVVDNDESIISFALIDQFNELGLVDKVYLESLDEAKARLASGEVLLILIFPPDFYEQTVNGLPHTPLTVYLNDRMPAESTLFVRLLNNAKGSVEAIMSSLLTYQSLSRPLYASDAEYWDNTNAAAIKMAFSLLGRKTILSVANNQKLNTVFSVISSLTSLLAMLTALLVLMQVQQERRSGMHERLVVANVPWWQLMLAKQLIGLVWLAAGFAPLLAALASFYPALQIWQIALPIILIYWVTSSLCLILGYLGRPGETMLLAAWLGLLGLLLLGGCIYPFALLPDWLQTLTSLSPARWSYLMIYDALGQQALRPAAILALAAMIPVTTAGSFLAWRRARST